MKKFFIKSMGCKSNQFEGQIIAQNLRNDGFIEVKNIKDANIYILNSCTVTHKSDLEALYNLRHAKSLGLKTILTGCIAQIEKEKLLKKTYIDAVYGNEDKFNIASYIELNNNFSVMDLMKKNDFNSISLNDTSKTRISLKIQDGCDNRCAYCIIPYSRGKSRSASIDFIINEINKYSIQGYKEVVLTGIHIGLFGKDIGTNLLTLLKEIENKTSIPRFRLGSLNPLEITHDMLNFLQDSEKFCPHFHLSLQSACNSTLKRMNRYYTVEYYLDLIENIYERFRFPFLGSDIITGFVGETDKDFNVTVENLKKSKLSQIHTFPYSLRKGTLAEKMEGHISDKIKEQRTEIIKKISAEKYKKFLNSNIGEYVQVLVEKNLDKNTGMYKGITPNYINVLLNEAEFNKIVNVKLTGIKDKKMIGEIT